MFFLYNNNLPPSSSCLAIGNMVFSDASTTVVSASSLGWFHATRSARTQRPSVNLASNVVSSTWFPSQILSLPWKSVARLGSKRVLPVPPWTIFWPFAVVLYVLLCKKGKRSKLLEGNPWAVNKYIKLLQSHQQDGYQSYNRSLYMKYVYILYCYFLNGN